MACKFSNGICGGCDDFVKTTAVTFANNTLTLTIPAETLTNGLHRCICIAQSIPTYTGIPNVVIKTGTITNTVIQNRTCGLCGTPNNLYVDQLLKNCSGVVKSRQILSVRYGTDTKCWMLNTCRVLPKSASNYPAPTTTPTTTGDNK